MNYQAFCEILNRHIFQGGKKDLLRRIAENPERFIGLFRPTKPGAKVLQHLLQSQEIRMGNALEEVIGTIFQEAGYTVLPRSVTSGERELTLDHLFCQQNTYYFIEQKIRDDHDSTKRRGQMRNFEEKLDALYKRYGISLIGIMYFIDPDLAKNKEYYQEELKRLRKFYGIALFLFYGGELFEYFGLSNIWEDLLSWLRQWRDTLPELPEVNFDASPQQSFDEIKSLELKNWRRFLENDNLWTGGIVRAIFREGRTLELVLDFFRNQPSDRIPYNQLAFMLEERLRIYYSYVRSVVPVQEQM